MAETNDTRETAGPAGAGLASLCGIIGPPRSGTTLIAHAIMSHPAVCGILEPYHGRRASGFVDTSPQGLLRACAVQTAGRPHLFVKETTTRPENGQLLLELLGRARGDGLYTGLVIILRCPFAAYLSQVEASSTLWKQKHFTEVDDRTFGAFASGVKEGLKTVCIQARQQHFRLVSYEAFCRNSEQELARLMALVPLPLDAARQLSFVPPANVRRGGDPKTHQKAGAISPTERAADVAEAMARFARHPQGRFMRQLRELTLEAVCVEPDWRVLDSLSLITLRS
jgi:hypothetical protein